jgi:ABC-type transport system involved in Fe-S cluster assembly fused permease/ATPase subunit
MDVFGQTTVRKADSIIVLNRGEIVEHGTWQAWVHGLTLSSRGEGWRVT